MTRDLIAALAALLTIGVLDALWLGVIAKDFVVRQIGHLMLDQPRLGVAALFYVLYALGVVVFAVRPALEAGLSGQIRHAAIMGALLGFLAYMTYDLSNMATLKGWPLQMVLVDITWGTLVTCAAASAGYMAASAYASR